MYIFILTFILSNELNANTIKIDSFHETFKNKLPNTDFRQIRQVLTLYGLSLFKNSNVNVESVDQKTTLIEKFFWNFTEEDENEFTSKSELRKMFSLFLQKSDPRSKIKSNATCNFLMLRGHNVRKKKRLYIHSNPVAVVQGVRLKRGELYNYLNGSESPSHRDMSKNQKMLDWLKSIEINYYIPPIIR